jgi:hypothetical protein
MSHIACPFCGKRLPIASASCWYCYKSLVLYFPTPEHRIPDAAPSVGTRPVAGHAMRLVRFGVLVLGVTLLFLLLAR